MEKCCHVAVFSYLCTLKTDIESETSTYDNNVCRNGHRLRQCPEREGMNGMYIAFAPLQGYTDAVYRRAHHACVGGVDEYYTPFVRIEKGEIRKKDLRDTAPAANEGVPTVPQVIARDGDEFALLCDTLQRQGWRRIDLNMGCPFPMQVHAGRGSGLLTHIGHIEEIQQEMRHRPEVTFSIKMRLGWESESEALAAMPIINEMPLLHVTLHPRLGRQQYKGVADREAFMRFMEVCRHPMVYNGDIVEMKNEESRMKNRAGANLKGVMIGRGLLARPWMLCDREPAQVLRDMHAVIYRHAGENLCGDSQILSRLHAFWEYVDIDRKAKKAILKATSLPRYREAVAAAVNSL